MAIEKCGNYELMQPLGHGGMATDIDLLPFPVGDREEVDISQQPFADQPARGITGTCIYGSAHSIPEREGNCLPVTDSDKVPSC
jgi:hypothetical protein